MTSQVSGRSFGRVVALMGDPIWTDVLFFGLLLLFLVRVWWVVRRRRGWSWGVHVLTALILIIGALVIEMASWRLS